MLYLHNPLTSELFALDKDYSDELIDEISEVGLEITNVVEFEKYCEEHEMEEVEMEGMKVVRREYERLPGSDEGALDIFYNNLN